MNTNKTTEDFTPFYSKHTVGPWYTRHGQISSETSEHGCTIANCNSTSRGIPDSEIEANARLIASAPELLETLQNALSRILADDKHNPPDIGQMQYVINKATKE
jgi:hypothetical protein